MHDVALTKIADLLLEARGLLSDDHPPVLRLAMDLSLFQVGCCIAGDGEFGGAAETGRPPQDRPDPWG